MTPWERATLALRLLAIDPVGLGGVWLRARSGPVRDRFVEGLGLLPLPLRKIHPNVTDEALYGGLDLSATLASGRATWQPGLLAEQSALILPMAERCPPGLAARLSAALDQRSGHCLIALDEGAEPDEALPDALRDRLALHIELDGLSYGEAEAIIEDPPAAPVLLPSAPPNAARDLAALAAKLGIASLRAPLLALRAAKAHAALAGRSEVEVEDLAIAAALVLAPRATQMPADMADEATPEPETPEPDTNDAPQEPEEDQASDAIRLPEDILLEAAAAALPRDLLERLAAGRAPRAAHGASGTGAGKTGNRRGRPLPSRPGRPGGTARVDLVATLRTAAPWQPLRRREAAARGDTRPLQVRGADVRVRRHLERSDRLLIFVVDASGSAAMARLAEAKGAVELLLAEAYARRDHVALVAFRGTGAEVLLPPTRSLVQTKRRLAALPGGGGTPLASGLAAGAELARSATGRGMTPTLAVLTDGRANIALDGSAGRQQAGDDAAQLARVIRASGVPSLVIDTGARPQPALQSLASEMGAPYLPMPRADAARLSTAVAAACPG
ncbi:MAG: magnesium chelatase subunit D [Pseudomonadota bacterium]